MKQGWEMKKLGEVLVKTETVDPTKNPKDEFIYLDVSSVNKETKEIKNATVLLGKDAPSRARKLVRTNDVIFATVRPTHSRVAIITEEYDKQVCSTGYFVLRGKDFIFNQYLFYFLLTDEFNEQMEKLQKGASYPAVTDAEVKSILLRFPKSLPEQQRIVAILDEAFTAISKAKTNAEQNLKNTKELFESYLQGVFENGNWVTKEFGEVITTLTDYHANGSYEILKANVELKETEDFAWMVRSTDFENNFQNTFRYTNEKGYKFLSKSKVFGGEIIMSKIGNAGNVYLMPKVDRPCSLAMNLFLIRLDEQKAIPEYTFQYLKSKKGEIQIKSRLLGMATKTITKDNVRNIIIPFPPLKEQQTIVQKLNALSAETKKLEAIYQKKINDLEELKKSVLQKAFSGELRSLEGAKYTSDAATPIAKKKTITSPERA